MTLNDLLRRARITWHGVELDRPDWGPQSHSIAMTLQTFRDRFLLHAIFNAYWEALSFELPPSHRAGVLWRRCVDTALPSPQDIRRWQDAPEVAAWRYLAQPRSVVVLAMALE